MKNAAHKTHPHASGLTPEALSQGLAYLVCRDEMLANLVAKLGTPPLWTRKPGFPTLIHIILEQQVSLASARATFNRLLAIASPLTPERFLRLDDDALKTAGFSRQKIAYGRNLARAIVNRELNLEELNELDDATVKSRLVQVKGIGAWTADIYMLMALGRPDTWPAGDLALAITVQEVNGLPARPTPVELEEMSAAWRPWRAVAAHVLWHYYLERPAQR